MKRILANISYDLTDDHQLFIDYGIYDGEGYYVTLADLRAQYDDLDESDKDDFQTFENFVETLVDAGEIVPIEDYPDEGDIL